MSELLQNWLNNEVGLSTNVSNFEKDFASGYLIGELLHKFRQQDDFEQFRNKNTHEAKIANFKRLEPTLKALGIKFNATQSNAVMNGERGASLRLLYQLKMASERLLLLSDSAAGAQARGGAPARPPPGGNVTKAIRVPREQFDEHERGFFENRLRATCLNVKQARAEKVTRRFEMEKYKQEVVALEMDNLEQAHIADQREIHRFSLLERLRQNKVAKDEWTRRGIELWQQNMQVRAMREVGDMHFRSTTRKRFQEQLNQTRQLMEREVHDSFQAFETGLNDLGITRSAEARPMSNVADSDSDAGSDKSELKAERLLAQTTRAANPREFIEALRGRLPSAQELEEEATLFLRKIKESKRAGNIARLERERRRRRVLVAQEREQELLEESKLEEVLLEKLRRESVEERAISYTVWRTRTCEELIVRHRQLRTQQYNDRKQLEKEEALRRDATIRDDLIASMRPQEERERVRYRDIEQNRQATRIAQLSQECEGILELISSMAFAALRNEQLTDNAEVDATLWREWAALFIESMPVPPEVPLSEISVLTYPLTVVPPEPELSDNPTTILDDAALRDYMTCSGQWQASPEHVGHFTVGGATSSTSPAPIKDVAPSVEGRRNSGVGIAEEVSFVSRLVLEPDTVDGRPVNYRLGIIVAALIDRTYAQPPQPEPPPMPEVPLKLVLSGKPFAGKRTAARRLAETYNLQVIDIDEVLRECLALSKRPDLPSTNPIEVLSFTDEANEEYCQRSFEEGNPYVRQLQEIGYEIQRLLDEGRAVGDDLYVHMLTTKIRSLFPDRISRQVNTQAACLISTSDAGASVPVAASASGEDAAEATCAADAPNPAEAADAAAVDSQGTLAGADAAALDSGGEDALDGHSAHPTEMASKIFSDHLAGGSLADDEPTGWVVVGFPHSAEQFALLEHFLSGWVEPSSRPTPEAEVRKAEAALLAPRPEEVPKPSPPVPGGYDLHLRLEVPFDEAVRRAVGRRVDPATSLSYHLEDSPPCGKDQVIYERLLPVDDLSNSVGVLTHRIHHFDVSQAEVDLMLAHFGPFPDVPRLARIDAGLSMDEVYESLDERVAVLLERKRAEVARVRAEEEAAAAAVALEAGSSQAIADEEGSADVRSGAGSPEPDAVAVPKPDSKVPEEDAPQADPGALAEAIVVQVQLSDLPRYVEKLEDQVFRLLMEAWQNLQNDFVGAARRLFRWHRAHLADFRNGLFGIQQRFVMYLQRPDDKQALVDDFVRRFNDFSEEYPMMRRQDATKEELHQRADDLQEKLRQKVETRRSEGLVELEAVEKSQWVESQAELLAAQVQCAVQLEVQRYHRASQLLTDFYQCAMGNGIPQVREAPPKIDVLNFDDSAAEAAAAAAADPKKKAAPKGKKEEEPKQDDVPKEVRAALRLRRFVPGLVDENGVQTPGHWEFPFLEDLMTQAKGACWRLTEYTPPAAEVKVEEVAAPKAKAKGRASPPPDKKADKKGAAVEEAVVAPPVVTPPLYVDLQQALLAERLAYLHRLAVIKQWAHGRLLDVSEAAVSTFTHFRDWVLLRRCKELDAISGLVEVIKEHIEDETLIKARLVLEGAHLHRRPNLWLQPPTPEVVAPPLEASAPFCWTVEQLDGLLEALLNATKSIGRGTRLLPFQTLFSVLARMTQAPGVEGEPRESNRVPAHWRCCDVERLQSLCSAFDPQPCTGAVDCVEFLLHIGLLHSPLGWPSLETLLEIRSILEQQAPPGAAYPDFWVTTDVLQSLPLFSDPSGAEASFSQKFQPSTSSTPGKFDRSRAQLQWVARVFSHFAAPLKQEQAWELEDAWYSYQVRCNEDAERSKLLLDDEMPLDGLPPALAGDSMAPLVAPVTPEPGSPEAAGRLAPRPTPPSRLPPRPDESAVTARQLLAYLSLGKTPEDGLTRAAAVLGPKGAGDVPVPPEDFHSVLLQLGARPTPPPVDGDGRPQHLSLQQLTQELELGRGGAQLQSLLGSPQLQRLLARCGLARRHCRVEVEKLFPKNPRPGARPRDRLDT